MSDKKSKCMFCGSISWGKNCPWSHFKNKIHVHSGKHDECCFCGSSNLTGPGCPHSPNGRHQVGANFFNGMASESFVLAQAIKTLSIPIHETKAFKMGIVNAEGDIIKRPETLEEKMAYSKLDSYVFRLKKVLGQKLDIVNRTMQLESVIETAKMPMDMYQKELQFKNELSYIAERYNNCISNAEKDGLPLSIVQKVILESFLK